MVSKTGGLAALSRMELSLFWRMSKSNLVPGDDVRDFNMCAIIEVSTKLQTLETSSEIFLGREVVTFWIIYR